MRGVMMIMRGLVLVPLVSACALAGGPEPDPPRDLLQEAWERSVRLGDAIIAVPGTGTATDLGLPIEARIDPANPDAVEIEARDFIDNVEVLEAAIAAAQRAGLSDAEIESGAVELGIWGAGITKLRAFRYHSFDGLHVRFDVLGGTSVCGIGGIPDNLLNYNGGNAELDARDLYRKAKAWLRPASERHVTLVSHSWGGVVAEYFAAHLATYVADEGAWPGTDVAFVAAAGVPGFVPDFQPYGPGFRTVGDATMVYEVDRPDDPVHTFDPQNGGGGHHYVIFDGTDYVGWYGITTDEIACRGVPGPCR